MLNIQVENRQIAFGSFQPPRPAGNCGARDFSRYKKFFLHFVSVSEERTVWS